MELLEAEVESIEEYKPIATVVVRAGRWRHRLVGVIGAVVAMPRDLGNAHQIALRFWVLRFWVLGFVEIDQAPSEVESRSWKVSWTIDSCRNIDDGLVCLDFRSYLTPT